MNTVDGLSINPLLHLHSILQKKCFSSSVSSEIHNNHVRETHGASLSHFMDEESKLSEVGSDTDKTWTEFSPSNLNTGLVAGPCLWGQSKWDWLGLVWSSQSRIVYSAAPSLMMNS